MTPRILNHTKQLGRENFILDSALDLVEQGGIATLTMDKLVREVPFSKGTIYNHFTGKEDLLLALCNRSMGVLAESFQRGESFNGISREKALAISFGCMLYTRLYSSQFMLIITAKSTNITDKSSQARYDEHIRLEGKLIASTMRVFQQAIDSGELILPKGINLQQASFAFWSLSFGTNTLLLQYVDGCTAPSNLLIECEMLNSSNILFDGLRFKPFSNEHDWSETVKKLKQETFKKEVQKLKDRGIILAI